MEKAQDFSLGQYVVWPRRACIERDGDSVRVGTPNLAGSEVTATVKAHGRGDKIRIFKFRRRKHYRKSQGHRQHYTEIEITAIK